MLSLEGSGGRDNKSEPLQETFARLRRKIHRSMKREEAARLRDNPSPSEEELYMGAFKEWLEPQVRDAVLTMYRKGYATQSSGFHATKADLQLIDGYFAVDEKTKSVLAEMGVEVLRGADIGLPRNKLITILRFRGDEPSLSNLKARWDAVAAALPDKTLPPGTHPICDRAEEFREKYAPMRPSLEEARERYAEHLTKNASG
jgi:hypothetical protein